MTVRWTAGVESSAGRTASLFVMVNPLSAVRLVPTMTGTDLEFSRGAVKVFVRLGCCAASVGILLLTFQGSGSVPF